MSADRSFLIASACAGVNFLITAFVMLGFRLIWTARTTGVNWRTLFFTATASYGVTIVANSVRISSALWLNESRPTLAGLDRNDIHRLDGILIYFGFLLMLFVVSKKFMGETKTGVRTYIFPLVIYYAMTLAVPIANGALKQGSDFWQHAAFVMVTPLALIAAVAIAARLFSRYLQSKDVSGSVTLFPTDSAADEIRTRANIRDAAAFSHRTVGLKHSAIIRDC